jgi:hypothetical protein
MDNNEQLEKIIQSQKLILDILHQKQSALEYINRNVACSYLNYGTSKLNKLLKTGAIKYSRVGRRLFIESKSLNEFIQKSSQ